MLSAAFRARLSEAFVASSNTGGNFLSICWQVVNDLLLWVFATHLETPSHRIHVFFIYLYIYNKNQPDVGKYASPWTVWGQIKVQHFCLWVGQFQQSSFAKGRFAGIEGPSVHAPWTSKLCTRNHLLVVGYQLEDEPSLYIGNGCFTLFIHFKNGWLSGTKSQLFSMDGNGERTTASWNQIG